MFWKEAPTENDRHKNIRILKAKILKFNIAYHAFFLPLHFQTSQVTLPIFAIF
jgi:hypothetical protein